MGRRSEKNGSGPMEKIIRVSIRRERPATGKAPCVQIYEVEAKGEMTILEILHKIYRELDPTIAYRRYRCGRRICRSCEVKLDGKIVRGCATLLRPGESYLLEPARPSSLIRDLVFEFDK
jgi:succinate dehydrogenase / fumarate reductase iron-sulfur subunit